MEQASTKKLRCPKWDTSGLYAAGFSKPLANMQQILRFRNTYFIVKKHFTLFAILFILFAAKLASRGNQSYLNTSNFLQGCQEAVFFTFFISFIVLHFTASTFYPQIQCLLLMWIILKDRLVTNFWKTKNKINLNILNHTDLLKS